MIEGLSYDDVLLVPQLGVLEKRKEADLSSRVAKGVPVKIPIVAANMPAVTEDRMANAMLKLGGQAVIHRFQSVDDRIEQWLKAGRASYTGNDFDRPFVAVGLKETKADLRKLWDAGTWRLCLDVAHGHHEQVAEMIEKLKSYENFTVMAGNVGTPQGAGFLIEAGADAVKVGIGPGAGCRTREVTGFGVPQLTAIMSIRELVDLWAEHDPDYNVPIIADGGIRNSGDIVKALAAGANAVMVGSLLAGADEAPKPGEYFGNASRRLNGHRAPEGAEGSVPLTGPVENIIKELVWGVRSGISYGGATNIKELQENAQFIRVAPGVAQESAVRV